MLFVEYLSNLYFQSTNHFSFRNKNIRIIRCISLLSLSQITMTRITPFFFSPHTKKTTIGKRIKAFIIYISTVENIHRFISNEMNYHKKPLTIHGWECKGFSSYLYSLHLRLCAGNVLRFFSINDQSITDVDEKWYLDS